MCVMSRQLGRQLHKSIGLKKLSQTSFFHIAFKNERKMTKCKNRLCIHDDNKTSLVDKNVD